MQPPAPVAPAAGRVLSPAQAAASRAFARTFNLPTTEILIDDFSCAIKKTILLHGRLFISLNYVCFYSNIFGHVTELVLSVPDIVAVGKDTYLGIPNAVKISAKGEDHLFASFMFSSRNECVELIQKIMTKTPLQPVSDEGHPADVMQFDVLKSPNQSLTIGPSVPGEPGAFFPAGAQPEVPPIGGAPPPSAPASPESLPDHPSLERLQTHLDFGSARPPVPEEKVTDVVLQTVLKETFPCSCIQFQNTFLTDMAPFSLKQFYTINGDKDVEISSWKQMGDVGYVRDISFVSKIVGAPMGPDSTRVFKVQKYAPKEGESNLNLNTVTVTPDVPYGDCFQVIDEWSVVNNGGDQCLVEIKTGVRFIKITWKLRPFQSLVEKGVLDEVKNVAKKWYGFASDHLKSNGPAEGKEIGRMGSGKENKDNKDSKDKDNKDNKAEGKAEGKENLTVKLPDSPKKKITSLDANTGSLDVDKLMCPADKIMPPEIKAKSSLLSPLVLRINDVFRLDGEELIYYYPISAPGISPNEAGGPAGRRLSDPGVLGSCVILTTRRICKWHDMKLTSIFLRNVKNVDHEKNSFAKWDKLIFQLHNGGTDSIGIYKGVIAGFFCDCVNRAITASQSSGSIPTEADQPKKQPMQAPVPKSNAPLTPDNKSKSQVPTKHKDEKDKVDEKDVKITLTQRPNLPRRALQLYQRNPSTCTIILLSLALFAQQPSISSLLLVFCVVTLGFQVGYQQEKIRAMKGEKQS